jgi:hypothetical protein
MCTMEQEKQYQSTLFAAVGNSSVLRDFLSSCLIFLLSVSVAGFARVSRDGWTEPIPTTANMCGLLSLNSSSMM